MGIFAIPGAIGKNGVDGTVYGLIASMAIATVLGFVFQMLFGKKSVDAPLTEQLAANAGASEAEAGNTASSVTVKLEITYKGRKISSSFNWSGCAAKSSQR